MAILGYDPSKKIDIKPKNVYGEHANFVMPVQMRAAAGYTTVSPEDIELSEFVYETQPINAVDYVWQNIIESFAINTSDITHADTSITGTQVKIEYTGSLLTESYGSLGSRFKMHGDFDIEIGVDCTNAQNSTSITLQLYRDIDTRAYVGYRPSTDVMRCNVSSGGIWGTEQTLSSIVLNTFTLRLVRIDKTIYCYYNAVQVGTVDFVNDDLYIVLFAKTDALNTDYILYDNFTLNSGRVVYPSLWADEFTATDGDIPEATHWLVNSGFLGTNDNDADVRIDTNALSLGTRGAAITNKADIISQFKLQGDIALEIEFDLVTAALTSSFGLYLFNDVNNHAYISYNVASAEITSNSGDTSVWQTAVSDAVAETSNIRFRIMRLGSDVFSFYSLNQGTFIPLMVYPCITSDVRVGMAFDGVDSADGEVHVKYIRLSADSISIQNIIFDDFKGFNGVDPNPRKWLAPYIDTLSLGHAKILNNSLQMRLVYGSTQYKKINLPIAGVITGDYDIQVDFSNYSPATNSSYAGIEIFSLASSTYSFMTVSVDNTSAPKYQTQIVGLSTALRNRVYNYGKLRITKTGTLVRTWFIDGPGSQWIQHLSYTVPATDEKISLFMYGGGLNANNTVQFSNLKLVANTLTPYPLLRDTFVASNASPPDAAKWLPAIYSESGREIINNTLHLTSSTAVAAAVMLNSVLSGELFIEVDFAEILTSAVDSQSAALFILLESEEYDDANIIKIEAIRNASNRTILFSRRISGAWTNIQAPVTATATSGKLLLTRSAAGIFTAHYQEGLDFKRITNTYNYGSAPSVRVLLATYSMTSYPLVTMAFDNFRAHATTIGSARKHVLFDSSENDSVYLDFRNFKYTGITGFPRIVGDKLRMKHTTRNVGYHQVQSTFLLSGNFDIIINYKYITASDLDLHRIIVLLTAPSTGNMSNLYRRYSTNNHYGSNEYISSVWGSDVLSATTDTEGSLRIKRLGSTFYYYFLENGNFTELNTIAGFSEDVDLQLRCETKTTAQDYEVELSIGHIWADNIIYASGMSEDTTSSDGHDCYALFKELMPLDRHISDLVTYMSCDGINNATTITCHAGKSPTMYGNAKISTTQSVFGGSAAYVDGAGDAIRMTHGDLALGTGDFTVEFFYMAQTAGSSYSRIFALGNNAAAGSLYFIRNSATSPHCFLLQGYTTGYVDLLSSTDLYALLELNRWHHIIIERFNDVYTVYFNGHPRGMTTLVSNYNITANTLNMGCNNTGGESFNGYYDDIRITRAARYRSASYVRIPTRSNKGQYYEFLNQAVHPRRLAVEYDYSDNQCQVSLPSGQWRWDQMWALMFVKIPNLTANSLLTVRYDKNAPSNTNTNDAISPQLKEIGTYTGSLTGTAVYANDYINLTGLTSSTEGTYTKDIGALYTDEFELCFILWTDNGTGGDEIIVTWGVSGSNTYSVSFYELTDVIRILKNGSLVNSVSYLNIDSGQYSPVRIITSKSNDGTQYTIKVIFRNTVVITETVTYDVIDSTLISFTGKNGTSTNEHRIKNIEFYVNGYVGVSGSLSSRNTWLNTGYASVVTAESAQNAYDLVQNIALTVVGGVTVVTNQFGYNSYSFDGSTGYIDLNFGTHYTEATLYALGMIDTGYDSVGYMLNRVEYTPQTLNNLPVSLHVNHPTPAYTLALDGGGSSDLLYDMQISTDTVSLDTYHAVSGYFKQNVAAIIETAGVQTYGTPPAALTNPTRDWAIGRASAEFGAGVGTSYYQGDIAFISISSVKRSLEFTQILTEALQGSALSYSSSYQPFTVVNNIIEFSYQNASVIKNKNVIAYDLGRLQQYSYLKWRIISDLPAVNSSESEPSRAILARLDKTNVPVISVSEPVQLHFSGSSGSTSVDVSKFNNLVKTKLPPDNWPEPWMHLTFEDYDGNTIIDRMGNNNAVMSNGAKIVDGGLLGTKMLVGDDYSNFTYKGLVTFSNTYTKGTTVFVIKSINHTNYAPRIMVRDRYDRLYYDPESSYLISAENYSTVHYFKAGTILFDGWEVIVGRRGVFNNYIINGVNLLAGRLDQTSMGYIGDNYTPTSVVSLPILDNFMVFTEAIKDERINEYVAYIMALQGRSMVNISNSPAFFSNATSISAASKSANHSRFWAVPTDLPVVIHSEDASGSPRQNTYDIENPHLLFETPCFKTRANFTATGSIDCRNVYFSAIVNKGQLFRVHFQPHEVSSTTVTSMFIGIHKPGTNCDYLYPPVQVTLNGVTNFTIVHNVNNFGQFSDPVYIPEFVEGDAVMVSHRCPTPQVLHRYEYAEQTGDTAIQKHYMRINSAYPPDTLTVGTGLDWSNVYFYTHDAISQTNIDRTIWGANALAVYTMNVLHDLNKTVIDVSLGNNNALFSEIPTMAFISDSKCGGIDFNQAATVHLIANNIFNQVEGHFFIHFSIASSVQESLVGIPSAGSDDQITIDLLADGSIQITDLGGLNSIGTITGLNDGNSHVIVFSWNASGRRLFVDTVEDTLTNPTATFPTAPNSTEVLIGQSYTKKNSTGDSFAGTIHNFRAYDVAVDDTTIVHTYHAAQDTMFTYSAFTAPSHISEEYGSGIAINAIEEIWHIFSSIAPVSIEEPWNIMQPPLYQYFNLIWGLKIAVIYDNYYGDVPVIRKKIDEYYSNMLKAVKRLIEPYADSEALSSYTKIPYVIYEDILHIISEPYVLTLQPVISIFTSQYDIQDFDKITSVVLEGYSILNDSTAITDNNQISFTKNGIEIDPISFNFNASRDNYLMTLEMTLKYEPKILPIKEGQSVTISIMGQVHEMLLDSYTETLKNGDNFYNLECVSTSVLLDFPFAESVISTDIFDVQISAKDAVALLASGYTVNFDIENWIIPANTLFVSDTGSDENDTGESPKAVISTIADTVKGKLQTAFDNSLIIQYDFPKKPHEFHLLPIDFSLNTDEITQLTISYTPESETFNEITVGNTGASTVERPSLTEVEIDENTKYILAYIVPFTTIVPKLLTSRDLNKVTIEPMGWKIDYRGDYLDVFGITDDDDAPEIIEIENGQGSTSRPVFDFNPEDMIWLDKNLGSIIVSEDGSITTSSGEGNSLLQFKYKTKYYMWKVTDFNTEKVQFYIPDEV